VAVLSIGSGNFDYYIPEDPKKGDMASDEKQKEDNLDWGLRQWAPYLRSILLDSSAISLDTNMQLLMGERYCRVNPRLPRDIDLDDSESKGICKIY
jgi:hypothetical protein